MPEPLLEVGLQVVEIQSIRRDGESPFHRLEQLSAAAIALADERVATA
jgi:hypothetical protein